MDWQLKGEGNANLILGYHGQDAALVGTVLRVRKQHAGLLDTLDEEIWSDVDPTVREMRFAEQHIGPLLGRKFVAPAVPFPVPAAALHALGHHAGAPSAPQSTPQQQERRHSPPAASPENAEQRPQLPPLDQALSHQLALQPGKQQQQQQQLSLEPGKQQQPRQQLSLEPGKHQQQQQQLSLEPGKHQQQQPRQEQREGHDQVQQQQRRQPSPPQQTAEQQQQRLPDTPPLVGQLLPDHTHMQASLLPAGWIPTGPTVCVEVKPKSGTMPTHGTHPAVPLDSVKRLHPRFKMHMLMKHVQDGVPHSKYDPRDFFSGDVTRVTQSLLHLLEAPSNNLRVFMDGELSYGGRPGAHAESGAYRLEAVGLSCLEALLASMIHPMERGPRHTNALSRKNACIGGGGSSGGGSGSSGGSGGGSASSGGSGGGSASSRGSSASNNSNNSSSSSSSSSENSSCSRIGRRLP
ncbi:MAG: hypothetical protein WDW36_001025 [Sanguina aurantia]